MAILEKNTKDLSGSILTKYSLNSTSYSGADIKVLVHNYGTSAKEDRAQTIRNELVHIDNQMDSIASQKSRLQAEIAAKTNRVPELERMKVRLNRLNQQEVDLLTASQSLLDELKNVNDGKFNAASTKVLTELQTLSISSFRSKEAVRALGHVYPKGFIRNSRSIAGTMIFTVFYKHVLEELLYANLSDFDGAAYTTAILDQIPPIDITIAFANEYGNLSRMALYGVEFMNESKTLSIDDIFTETTVSFVARDFDPMRAVDQRKIDYGYQLRNEWMGGTRASDLIFEDDYQNDKSEFDPFERFRRRNFPFY